MHIHPSLRWSPTSRPAVASKKAFCRGIDVSGGGAAPPHPPPRPAPPAHAAAASSIIALDSSRHPLASPARRPINPRRWRPPLSPTQAAASQPAQPPPPPPPLFSINPQVSVASFFFCSIAMSTCGNCDCADKSQCVKKGNGFVVDIVETEMIYYDEVMGGAENDPKCKCGPGCTCTTCNCGH